MVSWLLFVVILNVIQSSLSISSLSYHPDYSKLSTPNFIIIIGALINLTITLLVIIILFITRPKAIMEEEDEQILQISLKKKQLDKLSLVEKTQESENVWEFFSIQMSATSTDSKTAEEPTSTYIIDNDDYFKAMPELPSYMTHIEGGQPIVFHFVENKPEKAILPVYIMKDELMPPTTYLKSSRSEVEKSGGPLTKINEIRTARSLSAEKGSVMTAPSITKDIDIGKYTAQTKSLTVNAREESETAAASLTKSIDKENKATGNSPSSPKSSSSTSSPTTSTE
ncbi:unnamed protein product [Cercopithifilaria johnstoni]|uniref:Uncharacterized protein n=1 Tax=Cercopithifilaria johnstoni TaxID=2874296 RepID=A0A8J2LQG6_9BILA|nr:unnamed protein product [Cercopithifilaria johnstoni]